MISIETYHASIAIALAKLRPHITTIAILNFLLHSDYVSFTSRIMITAYTNIAETSSSRSLSLSSCSASLVNTPKYPFLIDVIIAT